MNPPLTSARRSAGSDKVASRLISAQSGGFFTFKRSGNDVKRKTSAGTVDDERRVGRRSLLTRGGVVLAGVVGATAAGAAMSGKADAATGDPVLQGNANVLSADSPSTEIDATSNASAAPTLILSNSGSTGTDSNGYGEASPSLRLTPAAATLVVPSASTAAGDLVATGDGNLWFTHLTSEGPYAATVHTDATSNSFVPLSAPYRILDTRQAALRKSILDPSGRLASSGQLLKGKTIHINLTSLVYFGDALSVNLTVTGTEAGGDAIVWPTGATPNASSINFAKGWTIANMIVSGIGHTYSSAITDSIAVTTTATTHVILDVAGFYVGSPGQVNPNYSAFGGSSARSNAQLRSQAIRSQAIKARW
jgi:hypothetical protein